MELNAGDDGTITSFNLVLSDSTLGECVFIGGAFSCKPLP